MKQYRVTQVPHFIGGRIVRPDRGNDSIVTLPKGVEPGKHLELVGEVPDAPAPHAPEGELTSFHVAAGRYGIKDDTGERVGEFLGTKEEAQAEAERLNSAPGTLPDA